MIKLVAFDWNGTLLADTQAVVDADNVFFKKFGMPPLTLRKFRDTFDVPFIDYYAANGLTPEKFLKNASMINELFHENYEKRAKHSRTRSGARQTLDWLERHKVSRVIFSNHTHHGIMFQLERLGIKKYFPEVLARSGAKDAAMKERNKGAKLEKYIRAHGFRKKEVLIVGDTIEEAQIARTLGIKSVAITGGYNSTARLKAVQPDYLIHNMVELEKIIRQINRKGR